MKFTIAIAALLATAAAERPVWGLRSVNDHRTDAGIQKEYGDHSVAAANARNPQTSSLVQLESDSSDSDSSDDDFAMVGDYMPGQSGKLGGGVYDRAIPGRFSADSDDIFMRSMITNYALEEKTPVKKLDNGLSVGGEPSGKFWMNEAAANAAAKEVLGTHKGLAGKLLDDYMNTYFKKAWVHFDVNQTGFIEVIKMPQLMRFLCSDQYMQLGESG